MKSTSTMTNWRWWLCMLLFVATTVNYLDRQVLSLTWKDFIAPQFHWNDLDYSYITSVFTILYAVFCLFAGKFIDWMGTKKGYIIAIVVWSVGACMHAGCGWLTLHIQGIEDMEALRALETGSAAATAVATLSVYLFLACRSVLALGESGNFPAAIKVTAEYFPKKDRALATSIFNAGASVGALAAPLTIPTLAEQYGWEMSFIIIGALGFVWVFFWIFMYDKPENCKHVNQAEIDYINQDDAPVAGEAAPAEKKEIPYLKCLTYRQTWSFIAGKFFTDGVWWFFLFWTPAYFSDQFGYTSSSGMGQILIFTLYLIVTGVSIMGGYLPKYFVEKKGMEAYQGRMKAMLIFAFMPIFALFAQPLGSYSAWLPAIIIGFACAGHQAWSANLFSTIGDMFPKSAVATITGIGTMAGGVSSMLIQYTAGVLFTYSEKQGDAFGFMGLTGKPAGYMIIFCGCAVSYLLAWVIMKTLVPKSEPIKY